MGKMYFKYGAMGASKSAEALMVKFNYEEKGRRVWLIKPATDTRDGANTVKSRIGLSAKADVINNEDDLYALFEDEHTHITNITGEDEILSDVDVIICDEAQFLMPEQIDALRLIVDAYDIDVLCYGLKTDFQTHLFPASSRLLEICDNISEIKTICRCGRKAILNARVDSLGNILTEGEQIKIGGNESYESVCSRCYKQRRK